jgi:Sec-independent protein secretion pathway component TatC
MEPGDAQVRRDARTVEIATAVLLGGLIAVVPTITLCLVGLVSGVGGSGWDSARRWVLVVAIVVGAAVSVWWLLRARGRGL